MSYAKESNRARLWSFVVLVAFACTMLAVGLFCTGCGTATGKAAWHVFKWRAKARIDERLKSRAESIEDRYDLKEEEPAD